jgi:hypothetical protein
MWCKATLLLNKVQKNPPNSTVPPRRRQWPSRMVDKGPLADLSRDGQPSTITSSGLDFASGTIEWCMLRSLIFVVK